MRGVRKAMQKHNELGCNMELPYIAYLAILLLVVFTIAITPWLALSGQKSMAALSYNAYVPTCHQWIYRSSCIFFDGKNYRIGDCIEKGKEAQAMIATEFTNADKRWDGIFSYSRSQIGYNRAERVQYANEIGYKFPNDTRNIGIYLFMLLAGIALPFKWKKPNVPHLSAFAIGILPLAIDGTGQMLGLWESTNAIRFATGALAGTALSVYVYALLHSAK